ncbi:MAG: SpoIIE family protein phosphatase [Lachnoclostridium sp.]|nr:SpoIIE family protein phosphatase [Lachnospira sp.]MCM1248889.1 SpoIIE family protein phosphatase [Lachnoclostridium sp.]MCM1535371.1 SpoIIE family protein phosphatase [Clostridium sp.]
MVEWKQGMGRKQSPGRRQNLKRQRRNRTEEWELAAWTPEFCRQKLLGYADSFKELSRVFCQEEQNTPKEHYHRSHILEEQRIHENRRLMGDNFSVVARIMKHIAEEMTAYRPMEEKKKRFLVQALETEGIYIESLYYLQREDDSAEGSRRGIGMTMYTAPGRGMSAKEVADMLSVLLHKQMKQSVTSPYLVDQTSKSFEFVEDTEYIVLTGFARATKEGETLSGDHYAIVESERGRVALLLSDGTGSGEEAGRGSEQVLDLMEKMMEAGYDTENAVNMVNAAFFAMGEESSHPTLDICELNLYQGSCDICKVGGAATFLKHGEEVEQIEQECLPLGIFQTLETKWIHRQLQSGDSIIMMTDGVMDILSEHPLENAVAEAVRSLGERSPAEMAEKLLQMALRAGGGHIRDDMTILTACIWDNSSSIE